MTLDDGATWAARLGAFMVPGLALWLPSGYSWGAALLLAAALATLPRWWARPLPREGWWLVASFTGTAALWLLEAAGAWSWSALDRPSKYLLALPCLAFLIAYTPRYTWLAMGVAVGAIGAGLTGLFQLRVLHLVRANGYTNAIQFGNLSLLLALMAALSLVILWRTWRGWQRVLLGCGAVLGIAGSVVSQTRGGWLTLLLLLLPACLWLLTRTRHIARAPLWVGACALMVLLLAQNTMVQHRVELAWQEAQTYSNQQDTENSVGYRIDLWRTAWQLGWARPWTGWGQSGYDAEQARRVAADELPEAILALHHAHNEVLDAFAKRGLPGVALLLIAFYGIPLGLFWPTAQRVRNAAGQVNRESLALCCIGVALPLSYAGFGLTQVFLAHNSGSMFYLFMCALVCAMLYARPRGTCSALP
ncbi:MAG: O-antigen ligase family protein [Comamonadaceae bacterium]|nr:O-antigen ligase family protein [Burkholderiales bacterium]MEB2347905.1 O-antigen ligase family protein [Comamonadaceae bacterium]